ncbi:MAG: phospholipase D-like domain-containing protein [Candidatus Pacebacteria bacterium]|nr:phospholipase D-like domain-containing protein [Candidatus Paceibacterota bacterium]
MEKLKNFSKIRILIGKEPLLSRYNIKNVEKDFPEKDFFKDLEEYIPDEKLKNTVIVLKDLIKKGILEIKIYRKDFLHAKCYILSNEKKDEAVGIIGSSNFTKQGLLGNLELNSLEDDSRVVLFSPKPHSMESGHLSWFNNLWNSDGAED